MTDNKILNDDELYKVSGGKNITPDIYHKAASTYNKILGQLSGTAWYESLNDDAQQSLIVEEIIKSCPQLSEYEEFVKSFVSSQFYLAKQRH